MLLPFAWHHMLDRQLSAGDALTTETLLAVAPAAQVVFDGFKHHAKSPAAKATVGQQVGKFLHEFGIIWPVPAVGGLLRKERLDFIADSGLVPIAQLSDELGNDLIVAFDRRANEHSAHHPAFDDIQRFHQLWRRVSAVVADPGGQEQAA